MNDSKYKYTLYLIIVVIIATIGIQAFWNYKNYLINKQQFIADAQITLDKAVDDYYTNLAHNTTLDFTLENNFEGGLGNMGVLKRMTKSIDSSKTFFGIDSLAVESLEGVTIIQGSVSDSLINHQAHDHKKTWTSTDVIEKINKIKDDIENEKRSTIEMLTSKIIISISNDTLNLNAIDSLIVSDLGQKKMLMDFYLEFKAPKQESSIFVEQIVSYNKENTIKGMHLNAKSKSKFLPVGSTLNMNFENETWLVFKRSLSGVLISMLLILVVISCLFYLLNIIKHQKQLSEVKNDLISNITHEFKTPIATIGVALESIQNFNTIDDKEKTKTYLDMSSIQLSKLNTMVEKLLETATLDSEDLELNIERYDISEVIRSVVEKHQLQNDKIVNSNIEDNVFASVDIFHFENAVNNIIDNAFKYGGKNIDVTLKGKSSQIELTVSDNGTSLSKANKDRIFEKFYRVPKGNTHDVKGFGIGLYYTKKIIEKHNGTIQLQLHKDKTTFKIVLPYA